MSSSVAVLVGLLVAAYVGSVLLARGSQSGLGLASGSEYLLLGFVLGPVVLGVVQRSVISEFDPLVASAAALIALAGGAELRVQMLREAARSLSYAMLTQSLIVFTLCAAVFALLAPYIPFARELAAAPLFGVCLLWGILSISRSPSVVLGILSQTRASGAVATFTLAFVMASDVVVVVLLTIVLMFARPLISGSEGFSVEALSLLGHELIGSVAVGTTLGLLLAAYLRLVGRQLLVLLLALGFGVTEFLRYVHIDPLLAFLTAGFVVQNLSNQGGKLLHAVEQTSGIVFVVFFATAGAHLDLPLLAQLWPVALGLCGTRAIATVVAARLGSRLAKDTAPVTRWGWSGLISQAGLTLGLSVMMVRLFPELGDGFGALVIATVAVNEMIGPVLFKLALDRSGESRAAPERLSMAP